MVVRRVPLQFADLRIRRVPSLPPAKEPRRMARKGDLLLTGNTLPLDCNKIAPNHALYENNPIPSSINHNSDTRFCNCGGWISTTPTHCLWTGSDDDFECRAVWAMQFLSNFTRFNWRWSIVFQYISRLHKVTGHGRFVCNYIAVFCVVS